MCQSSNEPPHLNKRMHVDPDIGWCTAVLTYLSYAVLIGFGHVRDFFANLTGISRYAVVQSLPP